MKAFFIFLSTVLGAFAIEKPDYETLSKDGGFEVRKYAAIPVVSAPMEGMEKRDESFRELFQYISGGNEAKQKIAMTSPVFMENGDNAGKTGRMSFMIPADVSEKGAPAPDAEGVVVSNIREGTFAILRFKGWDEEVKRDKAKEDLARLVAEKELKPVGKPFFAFYDPPWKPEFLRRNEIWQRIAP